MDLGTVLNYPCVVCHKHGSFEDHKWCYMEDNVLIQTVLEGLGEMLRRSGHTQAPYLPFLHMANVMDTGRQYIGPPTSHVPICPPAFGAVDLLAGNDVDALARYMENTYLAPPPYPTDGQAIDDCPPIDRDVPHLERSSNLRTTAAGSAYQPAAQCGPSPSYASSMSWVQGFGDSLQGARLDEGIGYIGRPEPHVETSFLPTISDPIPSISVIEHLEQGTYQHKQLVEGTPAGPIHFNEGLGVCYGALGMLVNGDEPAFNPAASIGVKASIRFEFLQLPRQSMRQVRMRHGGGRRREGRPITLREMGERVFEELKKLMDHAENRGDPLRHRGSALDIERVVLLRVDHISKGSIQPILGIRSEV